MFRVFGFIAALLMFVPEAGAQARRSQLPTAQAQQFEAVLTANPNDRAARSALLDYYFLNSTLNPAEAIPARRRHILWLIANTPADELAGLPAATIDAAGHRLADPQGFKMASDAWRMQVAKPNSSPMALANAARFFKLSDKELTINLLNRAHALEPANKEISARLGDEYALAIMGAAMVNQNGYPLASDPQQTQSAAAQQAREALTTSQDPYALAKAGYMLSWQGAVLYSNRKLAFDPAPLAEDALRRAVSLAPNDQEIAFLMEQYREIQRQRPASATAPRANSVPPPAPPPAAAPVSAPTPQVTADDLRKVAVGMNREQLLKIAPPAGRLSMTEDGHLIETYQYSAGRQRLGRIRLVDGTVSGVEIP